MKKQDQAVNSKHCVYAVHFADGRIKVGVTADVAKRMSYYAQESRRNRVESIVWWSCAPMDRAFAYLVERHFCREMRDAAMPRHREWFEGNAEAFASVTAALERLRTSVALPEEDVTALPFLGRTGRIVTSRAA